MAPLALVMGVPLLVVWILRTGADRSGWTVNWTVWSAWINVGVWIYWITAVSPGLLARIAMSHGLRGYFLVLASATLAFLLPPLVAIALAGFYLTPPAKHSRNKIAAAFNRMLGESVMMAPLAVFLLGIELHAAGAGPALFALVMAYLVFRVLVWFHWSRNYSTLIAVDSGELFKRVTRLAHRSGIRLTRVNLMRTAREDEVNAFATASGAVVLTEGLVNSLPPRELESVVAHELGHHAAGHLKFDVSRALFWGYLLLAEPVLGWVVRTFHISEAVLTLPIAPVLFLLLQSYISQRRELEADARGVAFTGDPEGAIAALGRLARLSPAPTTARSISGAILSHPSMESRALAIARQCNLDKARALAILRDPDSAYAGLVDVPVGATACEVEARAVFPLRARVMFSEQLRWMLLVTPLAGGALLTSAYRLMPGRIHAIDLLAGSVLIVAVTLLMETLWCSRKSAHLRRELMRKLVPNPGAIMAGLHPGAGVRFTEGSPNWDFGFVTLEGDWLCYHGEKTRFAIARQSVTRVQMICGPMNWLREHRVELTWTGGTFTLGADLFHPEWSRTKQLAGWLQDWVEAGTSEPVGDSREATPALPWLAGAESTRVRGALRIGMVALQILVAASAMVAWSWAPASLILLAPLAAVMRMLPGTLWPARANVR